MTKRVLIANRGEIAIRIARSCSALGYTSIGIAERSEIDTGHLPHCSERLLVNAESPSAPFLSVDHLMEIAKEANANLLHPGYGFLSESPLLSEACEKAGVTFVGPNPKNLNLFGDKETAKNFAQQQGLPVLESHRLGGDEKKIKASLKKLSSSLLFPLLIKAVAGGGGRGMRLVRSEKEDILDTCASASREALNFFGDGSLILEPYLEEIKHIEIQIACDSTGEVRSFFERECSAQRNYQKIIEEAPARNLSSKLRKKLCTSAEKLFHKSDYVGLATVEFLVTRDESFYFAEVNPRLQVEHPVTEEITEIDLVKLQFHLAEGGSLSECTEVSNLEARFEDPLPHSIELRVCAESAFDSTPRTGQVQGLNFSDLEASFPSLRIESGIMNRSEVTHYFDSMLCKLIVTEETRPQAIETTQQVLEALSLYGVETNLPLLKQIIDRKEFQEGSYTTELIKEMKAEYPERSSYFLSHAIAALLSLYGSKRSSLTEDASPWKVSDTFRLLNPFSIDRIISIEELSFNIRLTGKRDGSLDFEIRYGEEDLHLTIEQYSLTDSDLRFVLNGCEHRFDLFHTDDASSRIVWLLGSHAALAASVKPPNLRSGDSDKHGSGAVVSSPLPGKITEIHVVEGQNISAGEPMFVLESMKMEHKILSSQPGSVDTIRVELNQGVSAGSVLATLKE